jgi:hypothetical protein
LNEPPETGSAPRGSWFPSPKSLGKFFLDVLQLQRTVEKLRIQNEKQQNLINQLQRQVDDHNGQIAVIREFMTSAIHETAARSGERAAMQVMRALLDDKRD